MGKNKVVIIPSSQAVSGKYPPHLVIFSNFLPDIEKLSNDRWVILKIEDGDLVLQKADKELIKSVHVDDLLSEEIDQIEREKGYDFLYDEIYEVHIPRPKINRKPAKWDMKDIIPDKKIKKMANKKRDCFFRMAQNFLSNPKF